MRKKTIRRGAMARPFPRHGKGCTQEVRHARGFTLIASLLLLLLLSGIAIGLMLMVNTEGRVGGTDLQNNLAYHAAEGGMEKMSADLNSTFTSAQSPTASQICSVAASSNQPVMLGVTWQQYTVAAPGITCSGSVGSGTLTSGCTSGGSCWGQITSGPEAGLYAQIIPLTLTTSASVSGQQQVTMNRGIQVALIPVFQYGAFCDDDCGFFQTPNLTFEGRIHTNGDLYLGVVTGSTLTFNNKLEAYGNVVAGYFPNGAGPTAPGWGNAGNVYIPTAVGGCIPSTSTNCVLKDVNGGATYGDGSVQTLGGNPPQSTYNTSIWNTFSKTTTNGMVINGNYGSTTQPGTGAKLLSLPFVSGTNCPGTSLLCNYQIIRRPTSTDSSTLTQSREYNLAQIHVLLSDDPNELPYSSGYASGAADPNNVRLANKVGCAAPCTPYGVAISSTNLPTSVGSPPAGDTYNLYFATASNAVPSADCSWTGTSSTSSCTPDWPYPPAPWTAAMGASLPVGTSSASAGTDSDSTYPNCVLLCPLGAPYISNNGTTVSGGNAPALSSGLSAVTPPLLTLCPTAAVGTYAPSGKYTNCPAIATYPWYLVGGNTATTAAAVDTGLTATWNLIDGWLRVEYKDASGTWHPVTNEWLSLGFARGLQPPTLDGSHAPTSGTNPVNPNAILLLQQPADRATINTDTIPSTEASVVSWTPSLTPTETCTAPNSPSTGKCSAWSIIPPALVDSGSTVWQFGPTTSAMTGALSSSTLPLESLTRFNWYPINFYDAREGEPRDIIWSNTYANDNTCTAKGIMNAVEIDVGNLKRWLKGQIGSNGSSVDYAAQNGYILYFSDRRGMLPNPNTPWGTSFTKTGDSGMEDVINANGSSDTSAGVTDGVLEPIAAGKTISPEDTNENGLLDNYGFANLGLGFFGTGANNAVGTTIGASPTKNINAQIRSVSPYNPFGTDAYTSRIASCAVARKNWVSGARHGLKLVDGTLGNVPNSPVGTVAAPGGFTVASENPVYVQGDYNSSSADNFWPNGVPSGVADLSGHSSAGLVADAFGALSNAWVDQYSTLGNHAVSGNYSPTAPIGNRVPVTTYYRLAVAAGKDMAFPLPSWEPSAFTGGATGIFNFPHFMEYWSGITFNYGGSMVNLFYETYATGIWKCCIYSTYFPPTRNFVFDTDFNQPSGLPPGTPLFRDVETLSYRQTFANRTQ